MQRDEVNIYPAAPYQRGYTVDYAAEIDTPAEQLAEQLGLSVAQAERVLRWAEGRNGTGDHAAHIREIVALLMPGQRGGAVEARVGGLAAASGMLSSTTYTSMAALAGHLEQRYVCSSCGERNVRTVTRAAISHWATLAADRLGIANYRYCRDDTARENSRKARSKK